MDRKAWIAIILSIIGLVAWQWAITVYYPPVPVDPAAAATVATASPAPTAEATPAASAPEPPVLASSAPVISAQTESLQTENAEYVFTNDRGGIEAVKLRLHIGEDQQVVAMNGNRAMPIGTLGLVPGQALGGFAMKTDAAKGEASFVLQEADGLEITKRFTIPKGGDKKTSLYAIGFEVEFRNTGQSDATRPTYFIGTGGASPIHSKDLPMNSRFDWYHGKKFVNIDVNWFGGSSIPLVGISMRAPQTVYNETQPDVSWAAVTSQYFCTIISAQNTKGVSVWASRYDTKRQLDSPVYGIEGGIGMPGFTLAPGQTLKQNFIIYAGPKELSQLRKLDGQEDKVMNFGMFGLISEFLLWAMNGLNTLFHSYAAAIIVLTLCIKGLLWPVQNKATKEMRKMAALSPKMTEMRDKYKDDPQKLNEEMMKLYREYGVNPLSGCLPMLIQIPIFFGFYTMLGSAIELRNSSFFWIHDLSQPDTIGHIPGLNFPINLLPLLMAGTMLWQMAISPKSGDAMQQRMMYFMPIIFIVFCYNYASALALYWTTQNLFSIVQLYLTRNEPLPTLEKKSVVAKRVADAAKKKKKRLGS